MEHGKEKEGGAKLGQKACKKPWRDEQVEAEAGPSQASKRPDQAQLAAHVTVTAQQQSGQNASLSHPEFSTCSTCYYCSHITRNAQRP